MNATLLCVSFTQFLCITRQIRDRGMKRTWGYAGALEVGGGRGEKGGGRRGE